MNNTIAEPRLAPPGAGLPKIELLIARLLFSFSRRASREKSTARFIDERRKIAALVDGLAPEAGTIRVLIKRLPGMEDSSRHWSLWMTLDHLRIIHDFISSTITDLARGVIPVEAASTAAVKPSPFVTSAVRAEYEKSCDALLAAVAAVPDLHTSVTFAHPWFGAMDAAGWQALAATHLGIHRQQIEHILAGLRAS